NAGAMHENVAAAELALDRIAELADVGLRGLVAAHGDCASTALFDGADGFGGVGDARDDHFGPLVGQSLAEGLPNPVGSAPDPRALTGRHFRRSPVCSRPLAPGLDPSISKNMIISKIIQSRGGRVKRVAGALPRDLRQEVGDGVL